LIAVKSLERTIRDVESLLESIKCIPEAPAESNVEDCKKDIEIWIREARSSQPGIGLGAASVFRKFLVAVRKQSIEDVFREMAAYKESISLSLIATGRLVRGGIASCQDLTSIIQTTRCPKSEKGGCSARADGRNCRIRKGNA
jgi:hypothetical protein